MEKKFTFALLLFYGVTEATLRLLAGRSCDEISGIALALNYSPREMVGRELLVDA